MNSSLAFEISKYEAALRLHTAAVAGDRPAVERILRQDVDFQLRDQETDHTILQVTPVLCPLDFISFFFFFLSFFFVFFFFFGGG